MIVIVLVVCYIAIGCVCAGVFNAIFDLTMDDGMGAVILPLWPIALVIGIFVGIYFMAHALVTGIKDNMED